MIWNTIAHPKMMSPSNDGASPTPGPTLPDENESVEETPILKYADTTKQSFFDYIITESFEGDFSHKLVHGDFETVKNKILNHELVIGLMVKRENRGRQDLTYIVGTGFLSSEFDSEHMGPDAIMIYIGTKEGLVYWLSDNTIITDLPTDLPGGGTK